MVPWRGTEPISRGVSWFRFRYRANKGYRDCFSWGVKGVIGYSFSWGARWSGVRASRVVPLVGWFAYVMTLRFVCFRRTLPAKPELAPVLMASQVLFSW